jgi:hypothetical protein
VPNLRPKHSLSGCFSCRAGPKSTPWPTGRASPRSTTERGEGSRAAAAARETGRMLRALEAAATHGRCRGHGGDSRRARLPVVWGRSEEVAASGARGVEEDGEEAMGRFASVFAVCCRST